LTSLVVPVSLGSDLTVSELVDGATSGVSAVFVGSAAVAVLVVLDGSAEVCAQATREFKTTEVSNMRKHVKLKTT
jgi:hypothetical protein